MPPFLEIGHSTLEGPGQRGVTGSPGALCGAPPALTADICSCLSPPPGPLPSSLTLSPASSRFPPKRLDCQALDTQGALVPGFPGLSLCTSGRGPYLVFTYTSFVFLFFFPLIQGGNLK